MWGKNIYWLEQKTRALFKLGLVMGLAFFFLYLLSPLKASATINRQINFQGKIVLSSNSTNISNAIYNMEFKIYSGGDGVPGGGDETLLWTESHLRNNSQGVTITDGIFQVNLGAITTLPGSIDFNNSIIWLSMNLGNTNATCTPFSSCSGDGEMNSMVRFTASPYSLNSDLLDGLDSTAFGQLSGTNTWAGTNTFNAQSTFNTDVDYVFNGTENISVTSDLAGTVDVLSVITTPSSTSGTTQGIFVQQANSANTNGLDNGLTINNADTDLAITAALKIQNSGGGGYTTIIDNQGTLISGTELNLLDGHSSALVDTSTTGTISITGTGILGAGSIASGFGAIDVGADNITTTGTVFGNTIDRSTAGLLNIGTGGASNATSITLGSTSVTAMIFTTDNNAASDFTFTGGATLSSVTTTGNLTIQGGASTLGTTGQAGSLVISDGTSNTVTLTASGIGTDYSLTLPTGAGSTSQCLQTDSATASQLIFASCSAATGDNITVNGSAATDANFIDTTATNTVTGTTFTLATAPTPDTIALTIGNASGTVAGAVTATAQTLGGDKTFVGKIISKNTSDSATALQVQNAGGTAVLGVDTSNLRVGIGTTAPANTLSAAPLQYSSGANTASQSGNTITGSGTSFTSAMIGSQLVYANGTIATITSFTSTTSVTANPSQSVSGQVFNVYYPGLEVTSSGDVGVGTLTPGAKLEVVGDIISKGTSWTARTGSNASQWLSVTYGRGMFVAVAQISGASTDIMTSPDGVTWTNRTASHDDTWIAVTYGNGLFVAVASSAVSNAVMTSPDGITWTDRTVPVSDTWHALAYGNGVFASAVDSGSGAVMYSTNGINWSSGTSSVTSSFYGMTYGNGQFVAVAVSGTNRVMTSPDGINWTAQSASAASTWDSVTYGNGLYVSVASSGGAGNQIMTSTNGTSWTSRAAPFTNTWSSVTYGNGLYVAVSANGNNNRVMTSPDGITWTPRASTANVTWESVTYGNGIFVAVALSSASVMTSGKPELSVVQIPENQYYIAQTINTESTTGLSVVAKATPAANMVNITNTGFGITSAGVSGLQLTYVGGAAAVEANAQRIDLTGGTTGGAGAIWNGLRIVQGTITANTTVQDIKLETAALTTTSGTSVINGLNLSSAGAINNATAGSINWAGLNITNANVTQGASGTAVAAGLKLTLGSLTTGGTQYGLNIVGSSSNAAGTETGINIGNITAGASTETGLVIGTGWDEAIRANGTVTIGAQTDTASTGSATYTTINSAAGTFGSETARDKVASSVIYEGKLFIATAETNLAGVYRYDGGTTWTLVSSSTLGKAVSGDSAVDADAFVMTVFDGRLWIGSQTGSTTGSLYYSTTADTASAGDNFTLVNSARGTFATAAQAGVSDMAVWSGQLIVATQRTDLAEIVRYDGGTTFTQLTPTDGKSVAETTADKDSFVLQVCNNILYSGSSSASTTAIVASYQGNGTTWLHLTGTTGGGAFGAETNTIDITSMACHQGSLYIGTNKANAGAIYYYRASTAPIANVAANFIRINTAVGKMLAADTAVIDSFVLRSYNGRLYAGSQTAAAEDAGALFEYGGIPLVDFTLMSTSARGTFGSDTLTNAISTLQTFNGTLYIGTDEGTNGKAAVYTWSKTSENSFALRFDSGASNYGDITFVGDRQPSDSSGRYGSFLFTNSIQMTTGAFDYAEDYSTLDSTLQPGEPVAIDGTNTDQVKRASAGDIVLGVVSKNPGFRLSSSEKPEGGGEWVPIALVGRVPVRVSTDNGLDPIKAGDKLSLSNIPGVLHKARANEQVAGAALADYTAETIGTVSMFVHPEWDTEGSSIVESASGQLPSLTLLSSSENKTNVLNIFDKSSVSVASIDNQGSALFAGSVGVGLDLNVAGGLFASGALHVGGVSTFSGNTIFQKLVSFMDRTIFHKDVGFEGTVTFNTDVGGFATIHNTQQEVEVRFSKPYIVVPVVTVSIKNGQFVPYAYKELSENGFKIVLIQPATQDIEFAWTALSIKDPNTTQISVPPPTEITQ